MAQRSAAQIRRKTKMVKTIVKYHFGTNPKKIIYKETGLTNFVFEINHTAGDFIVRISSSPEKINAYLKEQWAVARVREKDVPVAEILEVGNDIVPKPYMIQKKIEGSEATHHPNRAKTVKQMGKFAAIINSIPTTDYGSVFDWSENQLSKNATWKDYVDKELDVPHRIQILEKNNMLTPANLRKLKSHLKKITGWKKKPTLSHGDIRLKNMIINDDGKIVAIIDWEECISTIAPYWDLSIAMHDLSIDNKQYFLEGYGLSAEEYIRMSFALKALNTINYAPQIERLATRKDTKVLEQYRLRLNGYFDLYSL